MIRYTVGSLILLSLPIYLSAMDVPQKDQELSAKKLQQRCTHVYDTYIKIPEIENPEQLRLGIFDIEDIKAHAPKTCKLKRLKDIEKEIYSQLTTLLGSKASAKDFVFGVIDDISDTEEESHGVNTTRTSYRTWQIFNGRYEKSQQTKGEYKARLEEAQRIKEQKSKEIELLHQQLEKAQQEEQELSSKTNIESENLEAVQLAQILLALKKNKQQEKMSAQQEQLTQAIDIAKKNVAKLERELSVLTARDAVVKKQEEIKAARQKLSDFELALAHVNKDLHTVEGTTSLLRTFAWKIGWGNYEVTQPQKKVD